MSYYMEVTAAGPQEQADIRFEPNGRVCLGIGTGPSGQGHETAFAQILEDRLGIASTRSISCSATPTREAGGGTGGAKSLLVAGTAMVDASQKIIAKGKKLAGHFLEASEQDIEFHDGNFTIAGTDRFIDIMELAKRTREAIEPARRHAGDARRDRHLQQQRTTPSPTAAISASSRSTRRPAPPTFVRYTVVDDMGLVVNPMIVMGQIHGGIVQGIGQALMEDTVFDPKSGQLLVRLVPGLRHAARRQFPELRDHLQQRALHHQRHGHQGRGRGGLGRLARLGDERGDRRAVALNIRHIDMPATPLKIWRVLQAAKGKKAA